jgi:pimeloyl-ACP methyl ester carboxylesterase
MATRDKVLEQVFRPEPVPADYLVAGGGALALRPGNIEASCADLQMAQVDADRMVAAYAEMKVPVAILYGRDDNLLDPKLHGERTAREIPGAKLTLVEGGHMLPFTQPLETAAWVRKVVATA